MKISLNLQLIKPYDKRDSSCSLKADHFLDLCALSYVQPGWLYCEMSLVCRVDDKLNHVQCFLLWRIRDCLSFSCCQRFRSRAETKHNLLTLSNIFISIPNCYYLTPRRRLIWMLGFLMIDVKFSL